MNDDITSIIRDELRAFSPYSSARSKVKVGATFLDANESPWSELYTMNFSQLNRYPYPQPDVLLKKLADFYGVSPNQLVVTRGSDEAIDLLFRLFCRVGKDEVIVSSPTYGMYRVCAALQGIKIVDIPLIDTLFQIDVVSIKRYLSQSNPKSAVKLIFLCSPNNPTGNTLNAKDAVMLCQTLKNRGIVVIDEAYIEYADQSSFTDYIKQYPNLVVLRTLSKAFGLAGIRIGCLVGSPNIVDWIKKIVAPYPLPTPSIAIALQAFESQNIKKVFDRVNTIKEERKKLRLALQAMPITKRIWPSEANFLLVEFLCDVNEMLKDSGIVIRDMRKKFNNRQVYRISIGLPEQNQHIINQLNPVELEV